METNYDVVKEFKYFLQLTRLASEIVLPDDPKFSDGINRSLANAATIAKLDFAFKARLNATSTMQTGYNLRAEELRQYLTARATQVAERINSITTHSSTHNNNCESHT